MAAVYEFGPYRQDPRTRMLTRRGVRVTITPKSFDTLLYLVSNAGRTVNREEIIEAVWSDTFVEEGILSYHISQLRKMLGEYAPGLPYIQTLPKQGYRFVANVSEVPVNGIDTPPPVVQVRPFQRLRSTPVFFLAVALFTLISAAVLVRTHTKISASKAKLVRLTSDSGLTMTPALSRDGKEIAYASDRGGEGYLDIWIQQIDHGPAIRLTHGPSDNYSPVFSPDARMIAFRSEREGGGIYIISALGGEARLVAPLGRRPRFSPNGKWIAYWTGTDAIGHNPNFPLPGIARIYIVPTDGGASMQIRTDFASAEYPLWAPDGRHLLFIGNRDPTLIVEPDDKRMDGTVDWWITPIDGGPPVPTGANRIFRSMGLHSLAQSPEAWTEDGSGILMSALTEDAENLWHIPISLKNWRVSGSPVQVSFGTTLHAQPSIAGANQVAFASLAASLHVWSMPLDPNHPHSINSPKQLTTDAFDHAYPSVSPDGTTIAYSSQRNGTRDIWVKNLTTGKEYTVSVPPAPANAPRFSADNRKVLYKAQDEAQRWVVYVASLIDGSHERIAENCISAPFLSRDGKRLLCAAPAGISVIDVGSRERVDLIKHRTWRLWNPRFSPDDHWISFNATEPGKSHIFVAHLRSAVLIPESEWIPITEGLWDDKPIWSPDGNTLYFMSERDGFRCIWAQPLDASKHRAGQPVPIFHAHEARRSLLNVNIGALDMEVARDKIVFNMGELTGNVWMTSLSGR